ncbi:uncharacterized protein HaLaN_00758 [Haematococcus lacustris]|uniref:Uncharacterized protein n=1 Tax=Haematococcus lacustris TaxID=44745 RepID=A0A699Y7X7_HAELA|nr:uncharacterized protein HaLaN_00758 [Haematococcus lacustris]
MDRKHYLSAWQVSAMGKLLGQNQYHGAWSTLFTATDPSLTGKGFGYYGPNWAGAWHATERQPGTKAARNPVSCWRLFEETVKVLENIVGSKAMPPVPRHPDESRGAASLKGNIRSTTDKSNVQRPMAVAA